MPFVHSSTLTRIAALYAEQSALYAYPERRKHERLKEIRLALDAAWQQRRVEKMREQLLHHADLRCADCGERLTSATAIWSSRRPLRFCVACQRARIAAGRQRQLAADRAHRRARAGTRITQSSPASPPHDAGPGPPPLI